MITTSTEWKRKQQHSRSIKLAYSVDFHIQLSCVCSTQNYVVTEEIYVYHLLRDYVPLLEL